MPNTLFIARTQGSELTENKRKEHIRIENKLGSDILTLAPYITAFLQVRAVVMALSSSQLGNKQISLNAQNHVAK